MTDALYTELSVQLDFAGDTRSRNLYQKKLVKDGPTHVQVSCTRRLA